MGFRHLVGRLASGAGLLALAFVAACADDGPHPTRPDNTGGADAGRVASQPARNGPQSIHSENAVDVERAAVAIRVTACRPVVERGAGLVVEPGRVLTSAHVVAGATAIVVEAADGTTAVATVVAFDPANDLAVLGVPADFAPALPLAMDPPDDPFVGTVVLFRFEGALVDHVEVVRRVIINTEDIYRGELVARPGYELRSDIAPGDSGAVIVHDDRAVAVVWSRSRLTDGRAWAIDPIRGGGLITQQLASGEIGPGIDLTRCS